MASLSGDLAWWRAHRDDADLDADELTALLERLKAWKAQHDADRARQFGFLRMAWDGVFGDDDEQVDQAIGEVEAALSRA